MGIEVINAAFGRTGTHSFQRAMEILGYGKCYHMEEVFKNNHGANWVHIANEAKEKQPELIRDLMEQHGYRATADMPASLFWHEQLQVYPDAKVVITVRDPLSWYESWSNTISLTCPDAEECPLGARVTLGLGFPPFKNIADLFREITRYAYNDDWSKQNMIKSYVVHIENVKKLCPPKQLLLFKASDGWEPLCTFLGVPIPDEPYPYLHDTKEFQRMASSFNILGWIVTILGLGIPLLFRTHSVISDPSKKSTNTKYSATIKLD